MEMSLHASVIKYSMFDKLDVAYGLNGYCIDSSVPILAQEMPSLSALAQLQIRETVGDSSAHCR